MPELETVLTVPDVIAFEADGTALMTAEVVSAMTPGMLSVPALTKATAVAT